MSGYGNLGIYDVELLILFYLKNSLQVYLIQCNYFQIERYSLKFEVEGVEANKIFVEVGTGFKHVTEITFTTDSLVFEIYSVRLLVLRMLLENIL